MFYVLTLCLAVIEAPPVIEQQDIENRDLVQDAPQPTLPLVPEQETEPDVAEPTTSLAATGDTLEQDPNDEWTMPTKKSKKDKKKGKKSKLETVADEEAVAKLMSSEDAQDNTGNADTTSRDAVQELASDKMEIETPTPMEDFATPFEAVPATPFEQFATPMETTQPALPTDTAEAQAEDEWATTTKKGKKGKKAKKQRNVFDWGQTQESEPATPATEDVPATAEVAEVQAIEDPATDFEQIEKSGTAPVSIELEAAKEDPVRETTTSMEQSEPTQREEVPEEWSMPMKKSRKDKKKNRGTEFYEPGPPTSEVGSSAPDGQSNSRVASLFPQLERINAPKRERTDLEEADYERTRRGSSHSAKDKALGLAAVTAGAGIVAATRKRFEQSQETSPEDKNRDSAIHVSPTEPRAPADTSIRDSGYVPSPVIEQVGFLDPERTASRTSRRARPKTPTSSSEELSTPADQGLKVEVDTSSDYDLSVNHPKIIPEDTIREGGDKRHVEIYWHEDEVGNPFSEETANLDKRKSKTHRTAEVYWPKDEEAAALEEPDLPRQLQESPAIESETKDRSSSILFDSSPSERTSHFDQSQQIAQKTPTKSSPAHTKETSTSQARQSLFGDGNDLRRDSWSITSPPRTPLNPIPEHGQDAGLHVHRHRNLSDVGQPDRGTKSARHSGTPHLDTAPVLHPSSGDRRTTGSSQIEQRISPVPELRDLEPRKSRTSIRSPSGRIDPYNTPPHARPSSAISNASLTRSETPPLRRVDRSTSGDLRAAAAVAAGTALAGAATALHRRSHVRHAKSKPTSSESELEGVASSSTYDPVRDKGKGRAGSMTDVYVSV